MSNESNKRLKKIRENLRYSQNDFAEIIGTKETKIRNIENGRSSIDEDIIKGLVEKLNININWLFIGTGEMFLNEKKESPKFMNIGKNIHNMEGNIKTLHVGDNINKEIEKINENKNENEKIEIEKNKKELIKTILKIKNPKIIELLTNEAKVFKSKEELNMIHY